MFLIDDRTFAKRLDEHQIEYFGYLVIDSQPARKPRIRDNSGAVPRKPLKGRKKIDEKSARIIPIIDNELWKELASLYNEELKKFAKKLWGASSQDYVLFEDVHRQTYINAYKALSLPYHSPHCCRHSRATLLIGETGDTILTRMWLGHSSQKVLDRYVHIYQAAVRKAKKTSKDWKKIDVG